MARTGTKRENGEGAPPTICDPLGHPMRTRIRSSFQGLIARTDGAIRSGSFDKRPDRHMTWRAAKVDEQGWEEINEILGEAFVKAEQAREDAERRLGITDDEGAEDNESADSIPFTFAMLGFESPPRKLRF